MSARDEDHEDERDYEILSDEYKYTYSKSYTELVATPAQTNRLTKQPQHAQRQPATAASNHIYMDIMGETSIPEEKCTSTPQQDSGASQPVRTLVRLVIVLVVLVAILVLVLCIVIPVLLKANNKHTDVNPSTTTTTTTTTTMLPTTTTDCTSNSSFSNYVDFQGKLLRSILYFDLN